MALWEWIDMVRRLGLIAAAVVIVVTAGVTTAVVGGGYELKFSMPNASGIFNGAHVTIGGQKAGQVSEVRVEGNEAIVTAELMDEYSPLHAGTRARISWKSVLGARTLELVPGAKDNPALPSGKFVKATVERVEVDHLLATLDKPTRQRIGGLVRQLEQTLNGKEEHLRQTLKTAGPAINALGEVMRAVGQDGPAIRNLVRKLEAMISELAGNDKKLGKIVTNLDQVTTEVVDEQKALSATLAELPSTVREATKTLDEVPAAVDATVPLLRDLRPATNKLPQTARSLNAVLNDLQPVVADLGPTLASANRLLQRTPGLLDSTHQVLPKATKAVTTLQPAVAFLRPYTPELVGWLSNWASLFGSQSSGNYGRALIVEGASTLNENPGVLPPGIQQANRPAPGSIAGQPWTDAYGDGMQ